MKRPRPHGDDLEDELGDSKGVAFKDWARRDPDYDRSASHRRFHHKTSDAGRRGSSSSYEQRFLDDDRELKSKSRKRHDHESDVFDRRKGGFDRHWDGVPDRPAKLSSSPRVSYSGDRMRRSESFSVPRREFLKGFRSNRDRSRREGSSGSLWRRSSGSRETAEEGVKSGATELMGRGSRVSSEDRGRSRSKESSSGEPIRSLDAKKPVEVRKESGGDASGGGSEMEEGELEPESYPVHEGKLVTTPANVVEKYQEAEPRSRIGFNEALEEVRNSPSGERSDLEKEEASERKDNDLALETTKKNDEGCQNSPRRTEDEPNKDDVEAVVIKNEKELANGVEQQAEKVEVLKRSPSLRLESPRHESPRHELENLEKEKSIEQVCKRPPAGAESALSRLDVEFLKTEEVTEHNDLEAEKNEEVEERGKPNSISDSEQNKSRDIDLQAEPVDSIGYVDSTDQVVAENKKDVTLELLTDKSTENNRDKGKNPAMSLPDEVHSTEDDDTEGPSGRGFELVFSSETTRPNTVTVGGIVIGKQEDEKLKLESLDLSLGLPGIPSVYSLREPDPKARSLGKARSIQSLPSFRSTSDGFMASLSLSGSQTFVHNASCSLTHNSMENYEHSVGSRPIFQSIDQVSDSTVWRGQSLSEKKENTAEVPFHQRLMVNNGLVHQTSLDGQCFQKSSVMSHQSSAYKPSSYAQNSYEPMPDFCKEKELLTREKSINCLIGNEQQVELTAPNDTGLVEKVLSSLVLEPLQVLVKMIQHMTEQSITHLKNAIVEICTSKNKHEEMCRLQEALLRRSDLKLETLSSCQKPLLEMLVAIKTGLPDFLRGVCDAPSSDLIEIFLNLKCRNLACRSALPVDECDCKFCSQRSGFCSMCMCFVCSKFDLASNTCGWIGCDFCLHWCHTDCALRESLITNDANITGMQGTETQFLCVACNHPSEMFGFVKEVFRTCVKDWKAEDLAKELEYVIRIFSASRDSKGRRLFEVANYLFTKLDDKANLSEVCNCIMTVLAEGDLNLSSIPILPPKGDIQKNKEESYGRVNDSISCRSNPAVGSSSEALWLPSISTEKSPLPGITGALVSSLDCGQLGSQTGKIQTQESLEKKPVEDELESIMKFKEAESKMYQAHADDARREAEGLKCIAIAKNEKIDAEYAAEIGKLRLLEAEERRRQKLEEFQALERAEREYFNMKIRMEAEIKDLILKMEATRRNLNA